MTGQRVQSLMTYSVIAKNTQTKHNQLGGMPESAQHSWVSSQQKGFRGTSARVILKDVFLKPRNTYIHTAQPLNRFPFWHPSVSREGSTMLLGKHNEAYHVFHTANLSTGLSKIQRSPKMSTRIGFKKLFTFRAVYFMLINKKIL